MAASVDHLPTHMKLAKLFAISTAILALLVSSLLGRILFIEWQKYRAAEAGLRSITLTRHAMIAAEKISFERGPANGALGDDVPADPAKRDRLARARQHTDQALTTLHEAVAASTNELDRLALPDITATQAALPVARRTVDQVAALPRQARTATLTAGAVAGMIDLVPGMMRAIAVTAANAADVYPRLTDTLTAARLAVTLREMAGQLGSQFTPALTAQVPLSPDVLDRIKTLQGRIEQLHSLILERTHESRLDPRVADAVTTLQARYFGTGQAFVASVEHAGRTGQPYGLDTAEFAARYVPEMASIVALRDVLLTTAIDRALAERRAAGIGLATAVATGLAALLVLAGMVYLLRQRVVRPLLSTAHALTRLAQGDLTTGLPAPDRQDEIGDILQALGTLRAIGIEKRTLEQQRQGLIDELQVASHTDYLTGILNRRAFNAAAEARLLSAADNDKPTALILFDLDHFKQINDHHGHDAGDEVLRCVADVVRSLLREGEIFARYGGEEFIAMPMHCERTDAHKIAERIRSSIEAAPLVLSDGRVLQVTASFGVACTSATTMTLDDLFKAADRALYRAKQTGRNRVEAAFAMSSQDSPHSTPQPMTNQDVAASTPPVPRHTGAAGPRDF